MKYAKRQLIFFVVYLAAGALFALAALLWAPTGVKEGIVSGIVGGFLLTGVGGLILSFRLLKNPEQAERTERMKTEERIQYIRMMTHSSVHTVTIILVSAATLAAQILGRWDIALTLAALLVVEAVLFVGFATYYSKKY